MSESIFVIKTLQDGWDWDNVHDVEDVQEYCEEELEIPHESICRVSFQEEALEIRLNRDRSVLREDWYVNLQRISA